MEYLVDYIKRGNTSNKIRTIIANSDIEALAEVLDLVKEFEEVEIFSIENLSTGKFLIKKPDPGEELLEGLATGIVHQLDTKIIELSKKGLIF